jgi:hypothetical protein
LQQELVLARDAVAVAQAQVKAAEQRVADAEHRAAPEPPVREPSPPPEPVVQQPQTEPAATSKDEIGERINFLAQLSLVGLALLLLGVFLGYKALDIHIRRQHGGYRVW